jgi:dipeptidyl aminopeptidase/acylaminoacyl peptidase
MRRFALASWVSLLLGCPAQTPPPPPIVNRVEPVDARPEDAKPEDESTPVELKAIAPAGEHPFSVLDLLEVDRVQAPALAPDGKTIAYVLRETDMAANAGRTSLWVVGTEGGAPLRLDAHPQGLSSPLWSPDGKWIYFVSKRGGSSQVWRMAYEGRAAGALTQVSDLPVPIGNLKIAPDGATLVVSAELFPDCETLACTADRLRDQAADPATGHGYDRMFVRHWDSWGDDRRTTLLALPAAPGTKDATILTRTLDADAPSKPFGGPEEFAFTPDSKQLVFAARDAAGGGGEPWSTNFDLHLVPLDASKPPERLTTNLAWDTEPAFSPDGKTLAWKAMARPGYEADRFALTTQTWAEGKLVGEPRTVTGGWDRSINQFAFAPDGARVWVLAQHLGHVAIFTVDLESGEPTLVAAQGTVGNLQIAGDRLAFLHDDLRHTPELWSAQLGPDGLLMGESAALTHHNDELMARTKLGEPEQFTFTGAGGDTVYGWVVKPVDFDPAQKYPLAFLIHGGPQGSFGDHFHYRWNPQTYAGAGYAVVMIDFHGSTGYGQAFTDAIRGDWGGKPLEDLQLGLAHALTEYSWLDGERACALGASYGGFMVNWIAGKWPDRFRCLVNHDGIFDQRSMYYSTEEQWFPEWEFGAPEFADREAYARFNPAAHVERWQTPMLVVHGSLDYRVPIEQGLATFTALQRRGIDSRLLHFPDENHWVLNPANSKQWHEEVQRWLDQHLKAAPGGQD